MAQMDSNLARILNTTFYENPFEESLSYLLQSVTDRLTYAVRSIIIILPANSITTINSA